MKRERLGARETAKGKVENPFRYVNLDGLLTLRQVSKLITYDNMPRATETTVRMPSRGSLRGARSKVSLSTPAQTSRKPPSVSNDG